MADYYKVMRNNIRDFIQDPSDEDADLLFCGIGFTQLDEESGAQVESTGYICHSNSSPYIKSYERTFPYTADIHEGGADVAAIALLQSTSRQSKIGTDAQLIYYRTDPNIVSGVDTLSNIPCRKMIVANENAGVTGEALSATQTSGTLHQVGDAIEGKLTITESSGVFSYAFVANTDA